MFKTRLRIGLWWMHFGLELSEEINNWGGPKTHLPSAKLQILRSYAHGAGPRPHRSLESSPCRLKYVGGVWSRAKAVWDLDQNSAMDHPRWDDFWSRVWKEFVNMCTMVKTWYSEVFRARSSNHRKFSWWLDMFGLITSLLLEGWPSQLSNSIYSSI